MNRKLRVSLLSSTDDSMAGCGAGLASLLAAVRAALVAGADSLSYLAYQDFEDHLFVPCPHLVFDFRPPLPPLPRRYHAPRPRFPPLPPPSPLSPVAGRVTGRAGRVGDWMWSCWPRETRSLSCPPPPPSPPFPLPPPFSPVAGRVTGRPRLVPPLPPPSPLSPVMEYVGASDPKPRGHK